MNGIVIAFAPGVKLRYTKAKVNFELIFKPHLLLIVVVKSPIAN